MTPQAQKVYKHLKKHKTITPLEALGVYGVYRLAARIHEIRGAGYGVVTRIYKDAMHRPYARYSLA